jgi:hypothetical protein
VHAQVVGKSTLLEPVSACVTGAAGTGAALAQAKTHPATATTPCFLMFIEHVLKPFEELASIIQTLSTERNLKIPQR